MNDFQRLKSFKAPFMGPLYPVVAAQVVIRAGQGSRADSVSVSHYTMCHYLLEMLFVVVVSVKRLLRRFIICI